MATEDQNLALRRRCCRGRASSGRELPVPVRTRASSMSSVGFQPPAVSVGEPRDHPIWLPWPRDTQLFEIAGFAP